MSTTTLQTVVTLALAVTQAYTVSWE